MANKKKRFLGVTLLLVTFLFIIKFSSAAHYIVGYVQNATDGTSPNDLGVVLWNPNNGINDNQTDIIGVNGNSGTSNIYFIDCQLLATPCAVGDILTIRIIDTGIDQVGLFAVNVTVTGAGFDTAPNITLNARPNITLNYPLNNAYVNSYPLNLSCTAEDQDYGLQNMSLFGNWSGGWHLNQTVGISGNLETVNFTRYFLEGTYLWNCRAFDNMSTSRFASQNHTFTVDLYSPLINFTDQNMSGVICGANQTIRIRCNATDNFTGINNVFIQTNTPSATINYSAQNLFGATYYADIPLNQTGTWNFSCLATDYASNYDFEYVGGILIKNSSLAELYVQTNDINISNENPTEGAPTIISAIIHNDGCVEANNTRIQFFDGPPESGVQIQTNRSLNISPFSNGSTNVTWIAEIGPNNFFVVIDSGNFIQESNETNNRANKSINVYAWQELYGVVTLDKLLGLNETIDLIFWSNESLFTGNIYVSDVESNVQWTALLAIGKNATGQNTTDDFLEIDSFLSMGSYNDSTSQLFTTNGITPLSVKNITVQGEIVVSVPIINSTNTTNFITGILWDSFDDTDGEYGGNENEDLVFVAEINKGNVGAYGTYDYEIKIPVRLRSYDNTDESSVYLYYELS